MRTRVLFAIIVEFLGKNSPFQPKQFAQRPRLKRAAAWGVRWLGVADFRDMTESSLVQMLIDWRKKFGTRFCFRSGCGAADADPLFDKLADQPRPEGALMVIDIAFTRSALVMRRITRLAWHERA